MVASAPTLGKPYVNNRDLPNDPDYYPGHAGIQGTTKVHKQLRNLEQSGKPGTEHLIIANSFAGDSIDYVDTSKLQKAYLNATGPAKRKAMAKLKQVVIDGKGISSDKHKWWNTYKGQLRGAIMAQSRKGHPVQVVCIQGEASAITQLEQTEMPDIIRDIKTDLQHETGKMPSIELAIKESYDSFVTSFFPFSD